MMMFKEGQLYVIQRWINGKRMYLHKIKDSDKDFRFIPELLGAAVFERTLAIKVSKEVEGGIVKVNKNQTSIIT